MSLKNETISGGPHDERARKAGPRNNKTPTFRYIFSFLHKVENSVARKNKLHRNRTL